MAAVIETEDSAFIADAVRVIARARGMSDIGSQEGPGHEGHCGTTYWSNTKPIRSAAKVQGSCESKNHRQNQVRSDEKEGNLTTQEVCRCMNEWCPCR